MGVDGMVGTSRLLPGYTDVGKNIYVKGLRGLLGASLFSRAVNTVACHCGSALLW